MRGSGPAADCKQKQRLLRLKGLDDYQCLKQERTMHASEHAHFNLILKQYDIYPSKPPISNLLACIVFHEVSVRKQTTPPAQLTFHVQVCMHTHAYLVSFMLFSAYAYMCVHMFMWGGYM